VSLSQQIPDSGFGVLFAMLFMNVIYHKGFLFKCC